MKKIFFIGLGKLGLSLATLLSKNNYVLGYDHNKSHIENLINKNYQHLENDLKKEIKKKNNLSFTNDLGSFNEKKFDYIYILIPTNQSIHGSYDSTNLINLINNLVSLIKINQKLNIVICSTLQPGTYRKYLIDISVKFGINFVYCPEFVALGNTIKGFSKPDILMIGGENKKELSKIEKIHKSFSSPSNISKLSFEGAEIVKLAVNSYVCTKISFANLISQICDSNKIDKSSEIVKTIGYDSRIGNKFFKSGPPFGGLCFPKDVEAFYNLCSSSNRNFEMIKNVQNINYDQRNLFLKNLKLFIKNYQIKNLGVLGLSFKEDTMTLNESQYLDILKRIRGVKFNIFDFSPNVSNEINCIYSNSFEKVIKNNKYLLVNHTSKNIIRKINQSNKKIIFSPWPLKFYKKHILLTI